MSDSDSIKILENSLREYIINAKSDSYNTAQKIYHRYNNLKVYMEPKKLSTPHFWVSVNISSACFGIEPLTKISGGLSSDERYVILWATRPNIKGELKKHWLYTTKQFTIMNSDGNIDNSSPENKKLLPPSAQEAEERKRQEEQTKIKNSIAEYTTGTGSIKKLKTVKEALNRDNKNQQINPNDE